MPPMTDTVEKGYEFPFNQKLLEESSKLKEERRVVRERLQKIEQNRTKVSSNVYQRVFGDYSQKMEEITRALASKKHDIDTELERLHETQKKLESNLAQHKEELEELQFRQELGEYDAEKYHSQSMTQKEKIKKFETLLQAVKINTQRYEKIFECEEGLSFHHEAPPSAKDLGSEEEEEDFFHEPQKAPPDWTETTSPNLEAEKETGGKAHLILISGNDNVGVEYPVMEHLTIGRSNSNTIAIRDAKSSRQHARSQEHTSELQ